MEILLSAALLMMAGMFVAQAQTPAAAPTTPPAPELAEASKLAVQVVDLYSQGRYDDALPLAKRALELREKALGPDHALVGDAVQNLAALQLGKKNFGEARSLFQRALKIFEKAYGQDSVKLAPTLDNIGWLYFAQGNAGQAEEAFTRSLALREKALGPDHEDVAQATFRLAQLNEQLGRYGNAVGYYQRTIAIKEKALGPNSPQLVDYLQMCACALAENGQRKESVEMQKRVHEIRNPTDARKTHSVTGGVLQGKAVTRIEPVYPFEAKQRRIGGSVIVEVTVDETGNVVAARALCGPALLRPAAVEAARQWRFTPTSLNGVPTKVIGTITFNFSITR